MKPSQWKEEVDRAIAASGLPWRVSSTWLEDDAGQCCAIITDRRFGRDRTIRFSQQEFSTEQQRRAELVRQLTKLTTG